MKTSSKGKPKSILVGSGDGSNMPTSVKTKGSKKATPNKHLGGKGK